MAIKKQYVVSKTNYLNGIRPNEMTLQELRFFSIYLSKINPRNIDTRIVRFKLKDFKKIMELDQIKIKYISSVTDGLLCKIVRISTPRGGYDSFQLFKRCLVDVDEDGEWFVEIDAHDQALPYMFDYKDKYFTYKLWNALNLKSSNQLRMYEILKQYEKFGYRVINIDELRDLLGIEKAEYPRWQSFKTRVLDSCQKALEEKTDLKFTYEPYSKRGKGNKILTLKFNIFKNENYTDPLTLEQFIGGYDEYILETLEESTNDKSLDPYEYFENKQMAFYSEACKHEFTEKEIAFLYDIVIKIIPYSHSKHRNMQLEYYDFFKKKHDELEMRASKTNIKYRFAYIKKLIELELDLEEE